MTAPLNLEGVYPRRNQHTGKPSMERFVEKLAKKCAAAVLFLAAALILYMIFSLLTFPPPPHNPRNNTCRKKAGCRTGRQISTAWLDVGDRSEKQRDQLLPQGRVEGN